MFVVLGYFASPRLWSVVEESNLIVAGLEGPPPGPPADRCRIRDGYRSSRPMISFTSRQRRRQSTLRVTSVAVAHQRQLGSNTACVAQLTSIYVYPV